MKRHLLRRVLSCLLGSLAFVAANTRAADPSFDLIIRHGKIIDGSGNPWFHGDVAIKGDRIVAVGPVTGEPDA